MQPVGCTPWCSTDAPCCYKNDNNKVLDQGWKTFSYAGQNPFPITVCEPGILKMHIRWQPQKYTLNEVYLFILSHVGKKLHKKSVYHNFHKRTSHKTFTYCATALHLLIPRYLERCKTMQVFSRFVFVNDVRYLFLQISFLKTMSHTNMHSRIGKT